MGGVAVPRRSMLGDVMAGFRNAIVASIPRVFSVAFVLTHCVVAAASAQQMSPQQRDFAALHRQCAEQIRGSDAEPARQSVREACQGQLQEIIGSKLDNWVGRVTSVRHSAELGKVIGLAVVPAELAEEGARFDVRIGKRLEQMVVHLGPFFDPSGERLKA